MDHPLKQSLEALAEHHKERVEEVLAEHGMTRTDVLTLLMQGRGDGIPYEVAKEMHLADAYARIVNIENYCPDREWWSLKTYVDKLVEGLYAWVAGNHSFLDMALELDATKSVPNYTEDEIYQTIALVAIKHQELKDERSTTQGTSS